MAKTKTFVLNTEAINSFNIILLTEGLVLDYFIKNPSLFIDHKVGAEDVAGRWENLRVEDGKFLGDSLFDLKDDFVAKIARKVDDGFINGASLGGRPIEWHFKEIDDVEVCICTKFYVLEASVVAIPSNKSCIRLYDTNNSVIENWTFSDLKKLDFVNKTPVQKMDFKKIALSLGLSETASEAEILAAVNSNNSASVQLADLQKKQKESQAGEIIQLMDKVEKINPALASMRQTYIQLGDTNFDLAKATLEGLLTTAPVNVTLSDIARGKAFVHNTNLQLPQGKETWTFSDWEKKDPTGLQQLQKSNPNGFEALYQQTYGVDFKTDISLVGAVPEK